MRTSQEPWLDSFMDYTDKIPTPEVFRRWAGISMIAAALERKVWLETSVGTLYPNLYMFLLAPPGVGKTIMSSMAWRMTSKLRDHKIASPYASLAAVSLSFRTRQRSVGTGEITIRTSLIKTHTVLKFAAAMMNECSPR